MSKYAIEIWDKTGKPVADIRKLCSNLKWSKTLNNSESVSFDIDLNELEKTIQSLGYSEDVFGFFEVGRSDIRIKRDNDYIIGCNVYSFNYATNDPSVKVTVQCVGYLNFYKSQYVTATFSQQYQEDILWAVINQCNQKTGGDYGVRRGVDIGGGRTKRDRNYSRKEVASLILQMSQVIDGPDFDFSPDKKFNTYAAKGAYRPDVRLTYPGNIQEFSFNRTVEKVANYIYGIGSGNGDDAVQSTAEDATSENYIYRREKVMTWNSVVEQDTLNEHTNASLHYYKDIIELPSVTLKDNTLDLSQVDVGDTISLELLSNISLRHVNGFYRIEKIDCTVDENDSEKVQLTFDNLDIDEIIEEQESDD